MSRRAHIVYVTSNPHKQEENRVFVEHCTSGRRNADSRGLGRVRVSREAQKLQILETDILKDGFPKSVAKAYSQIRVPCIVEYAGLLFDKYLPKTYPRRADPKAMWNTLEGNFASETNSANLRATAQAVIGY